MLISWFVFRLRRWAGWFRGAQSRLSLKLCWIPGWSWQRAELFHYLVFYTGTQTLRFGPRLRAVPVSALWQA